MALPRVVAVAPGSPADRAGVQPGDEIVALDGQLPRDIIEYQLLADQASLGLEVSRGGIEISLQVEREGGEPLGMEVDAALFDRVRTCDNHCEFCFIHQLPKGMRKNLYVRDDDYRLSFLYGNFTTLTRFTESDLERVLTEGLSPLFVSIHSTDPEVRARMLRNRRRRHKPALAACAPGRRRRGARPGRRLPRRQRRRDLGGDAGRRPRRVPRTCQRGLRASRGEPLQPRAGDAAPRRRRGRFRRRPCRTVAGDLPRLPRQTARVCRRRVLPGSGAPVPGARDLRGGRPARQRHRHGPSLRGSLRGTRPRGKYLGKKGRAGFSVLSRGLRRLVTGRHALQVL